MHSSKAKVRELCSWVWSLRNCQRLPKSVAFLLLLLCCEIRKKLSFKFEWISQTALNPHPLFTFPLLLFLYFAWLDFSRQSSSDFHQWQSSPRPVILGLCLIRAVRWQKFLRAKIFGWGRKHQNVSSKFVSQSTKYFAFLTFQRV